MVSDPAPVRVADAEEAHCQLPHRPGACMHGSPHARRRQLWRLHPVRLLPWLPGNKGEGEAGEGEAGEHVCIGALMRRGGSCGSCIQ